MNYKQRLQQAKEEVWQSMGEPDFNNDVAENIAMDYDVDMEDLVFSLI